MPLEFSFLFFWHCVGIAILPVYVLAWHALLGQQLHSDGLFRFSASLLWLVARMMHGRAWSIFGDAAWSNFGWDYFGTGGYLEDIYERRYHGRRTIWHTLLCFTILITRLGVSCNDFDLWGLQRSLCAERNERLIAQISTTYPIQAVRVAASRFCLTSDFSALALC